MPNSSIYINQIALDQEFYVWASGQDLRRFNGSTWEYYDSSNSAVPQASPYYLDTRSISMDNEDKAWVGVAQGVTSGYNEVAVFYVNTNNLAEGKSWNFSDLGTFNQPQEVSLVHACQFGDDILAFINPLNGVGGTAGVSSYTRITGVTGGRLFYYLKETDQWKETVENYTWPHIYDIKTKGYNGVDYFYYVGTAEGLFVLPQGSLQTLTLSNGSEYIQQAKVYNTNTSGIISDNVYCIDFDENGNLWIGTDMGLSYFDGSEFWNYGLTGGPITSIKSRENGHVFYSKGDGELLQGTGLWHFNGTTHTQYTSSNSSLLTNDVLEIKLIEHSNTQESLTIRENDLWVLGYNTISLFDYDIPHVYASSKYEGATGWNFTYYSPTGAAAPLPKINKYTWTYPEWLVYDNSFLEDKHPGLDPDNLFLTTKLSDIADGRAGKQPYWNNWPFPTFEQDQISESIQSSSWTDFLSYISGASGSIDMIKITSSTVQEFQGERKYYIGGYLEPNISSGDYSVQFGYYSDSTPAILSSSNPTINSNLSSTNNTVNSAKTGFIVSYSESGNVDAILPFRGTSTEIQSLCSSQDGLYVFASGIFNKYMEVGEYLWGAYEADPSPPLGPIGAPMGVTNYFVPGTTSWVWIGNPSTPAPFLDSVWNIYPGTQDLVPSGAVDLQFFGVTAGSTGTYQNLEKVYLNFIDSGSVNRQTSLTSSTPIGGAIQISIGTESAVYRIDSPSYKDANSVSYSLTYQSGSTSIPGYATGGTASIRTYSRHTSVYPYTLYNTGYIDPDSTAIFVVKIGRDLGSTSTFTDINGVTGDYPSSVRKKYRVNSFRRFPPVSTYPGGTASTKLDSSKYYVNLAISHESSSPVTFNALKNQWNRTTDLPSCPSYIGDPTSNQFGAYVKLDSDILDLVEIKNTSGTTGGFSIGDIKSANNESGFVITGQSSGSFDMMGISVTHPSPSAYKNYPFYLISGPTANGITGGIVDIGGTSAYSNIKKITQVKDDSGYYVSTIMGDYGQGVTGNYFGSQTVLGSTGQNYIYTAKITDQGTLINTFYNQTGVLDRDMGLLSLEKLDDSQFFTSYEINTPGLTGYNVALLKMNNANKNLDIKNLGTFEGDLVFSKDSSDNIFISGINTSGATGGTGSFIFFGSTGGFSSLSKQYYPELGINLGNIISRPGSGAWTWCDVHSTDNYMEIPLMSTVVFNNYSSNIYGKNSNKWILSNPETGEEYLNVKETPYFIYTFTNPGFYSIYNQVEDSYGNIYEVSKPGFIKVVNHKEKRADDPKPDFVDSIDYGYGTLPLSKRAYQTSVLNKELEDEEKSIMEASEGQFGSAIIIPDNPDSTFNR